MNQLLFCQRCNIMFDYMEDHCDFNNLRFPALFVEYGRISGEQHF